MGQAVFPSLPGLKWDVTKSPQWLSRVQQSISGKEVRAAFRTSPIYQWQLSYEILRQSSAFQELQSLIAFFNSRQGKFDSFLLSDPSDNGVTAQGFGVGDGSTTAFQLQRTPGGNRRINAWDPTIYPIYTTPRKNLLIRTEELDNAGAWALSNSTVGANGSLAPDGTLTADKIQEDNANAVHPIAQSVSGLVDSTVYTFSCFLKQGDRPWALLNLQGKDSLSRQAYFNLATGAIGTVSGGATAFAPIAMSGGWWRCGLAASVATGGATPRALIYPATADLSIGYVGTTGAGIYGWGADLKIGSGLSSYIKNTSAVVAQSPAYWPLVGDGFEPVYDVDYSQSQPSIFVDGVLKTYANGDYTISPTGVVTFPAAPVAGAALTWTGNYYWRVRFADDATEFNNFLTQLWEAKKVTLCSVK